MPIKSLFAIIFFLLNSTILSAQAMNTIRFVPYFEDKMIENDSIYYFKNENIALKKDSIQFENIKFYITNIAFLLKNKPVFIEKNEGNNGAHLIDNADDISKKIVLKTPKNIEFDAIKFDIGVDSLTNVSGAMGGALDPTSGMYWAWQSGYINAKIEGKTNICPTRRNEFQFHLGGYLGNNYALQTLVLPVINTNTINIYLDMVTFLQQTNMEKTNQIMSPSSEAVLLSKRLAGYFSIIK
jgi:hypothetical protein